MRIGQHLQLQQQYMGDDIHEHDKEDSLSDSSWTSSLTSEELVRASRLSSHLFFQLIRESPIHVSRTKSLPASYLSPSLIGSLWGLGESDLSLGDARKFLRERHGIRSNYIHSTEWTGISLARWMDLILPAPSHGSSRRMHHPGKLQQQRRHETPPPLTSAVWLMTLWELSNSKLDFLDCLLSLEAALPRDHPGVLDISHPLTLALLNDPIAREEWADSTFSEEDAMDFSSDLVQGSLEQLMLPPDSVGTVTRRYQQSDATAMEIICAAISLNHIPLNSKPVCPTGYYGFDGGGIQADCAELTVREVVNLLLWDEAEGRFDVRRLPPTASKRLVELYDETRHPFEELGGLWFDLLSDLPGCEYFLKSPNGRPYELIPTIANISKALQIVLVGRGNEKVEPEWTSLQDLKNAWEPHKLQIFENTLTHRSSTTGELIHHEFATLHLENSSSGIELRLRCDMNHMSGMSKVTHLRERRPMLVDGEHWNLVPLESPTKQMLGLCIGADAISSAKRRHIVNEFDSVRNLISMLTTPFGRDRRRLLTCDVSESDRVEMKTQSENVLKSAIITACRQSHDDDLLGMTILPWLLNETPTVFESASPIVRDVDRDVEDCILTLPRIIIDNSSIHDALEFNWVVHGQPLKAWARWKSGSCSMKETILGLRLSDVPTFVKMALTR